MSNPHPTYRPDIDGLRAIAVLAVVIFHAFPGRLSGGFVGVDVFFVISGFLITGIILGAIDEGRFTFRDFYIRRVRRIFPALGLVLLCVLVAGWLLLMPNDFRGVGKHVAGGAGFIANILLYFEIDYFDGDSGYKPLLHLWSLGVEEQYYLFWPVLLCLCRGSRRAAGWMIAGIAVASFAANLYLVDADPDAAFYLPWSRFWELMFGSGLAVASPAGGLALARVPRAARELASVAGLAAILVPMVLIDETAVFPGWWALLVVAGTTATIWAGPDTLLNRQVLSMRPMVGIGLISYPLYLWHWPLISFGWNIYGYEISREARVIAVVLSFVLAWATWRFVEAPFRTRRTPAQAGRMALRLAAVVFGFGFAGLLVQGRLVQARAADDPQLVAISEAVQDGTSPGGVLVLNPAGSPTVMFIGDSLMSQYQPRLQWLADQGAPGLPRLEAHTQGGCPPIPGIERRIRGYCNEVMTRAFGRAMQPDVSRVVISGAWVRMQANADIFFVGRETAADARRLSEQDVLEVLELLREQIHLLRVAGKEVVVLLSSPGGHAFDPRMMVDRSVLLPRARVEPVVDRLTATADTRDADALVRHYAEAAGADIADPADWICDGDRCPTIDADGRPISPDGWHLRPGYVRDQLSGFDTLAM